MEFSIAFDDLTVLRTEVRAPVERRRRLTLSEALPVREDSAISTDDAVVAVNAMAMDGTSEDDPIRGVLLSQVRGQVFVTDVV